MPQSRWERGNETLLQAAGIEPNKSLEGADSDRLGGKPLVAAHDSQLSSVLARSRDGFLAGIVLIEEGDLGAVVDSRPHGISISLAL